MDSRAVQTVSYLKELTITFYGFHVRLDLSVVGQSALSGRQLVFIVFLKVTKIVHVTFFELRSFLLPQKKVHVCRQEEWRFFVVLVVVVVVIIVVIVVVVIVVVGGHIDYSVDGYEEKAEEGGDREAGFNLFLACTSI